MIKIKGEMFCHKKIVVILIAGRMHVRACMRSNLEIVVVFA